MKDLEHQIYMRLIVEKDMSMSEIQAAFPQVSDRTIIRKINAMSKTGQIDHKRIRKQGKRERYFVKEENTKHDMRIRAFEIKGKSYKEIRPTMTQRQISSIITEKIKFYKQELNKLKNEPKRNYYLYHIAMISGCLESISQLTFAINSGILGNSPNKLALALRNKERNEEFLQKLIFNIKKKDEELANEIIQGIQYQLIDLWFLEKLMP